MRDTIVPPRAAMIQLLGRKRRRGRRPQVPPAWERLNFALNTPAQHPQQDNEILLGVQPLVRLDELEVGVNLAEEFGV